ncbi:MAG: hypothetical protein GEV03_14060 [Streptosporangiales bacterium]|nr:hypothetical protein [Streptosporangiales bacterium]
MSLERGPRLSGGAGRPALQALQRFLEPRPAAAPGERCEMCTEPIDAGHSHVVDLASRNLMCTCRGCYLLFTSEGAAGGKYRAIPDRYRYLPGLAISDGQWDELQIPVGMAFFFHNSDLGRFVAFYPSPGGATESLLPLDTWREVLEANPAVADLAPDVEALLLRRLGGRQVQQAGEAGGEDVTECYLVPIDACYDLVGRVRTGWRGFQGGQEVWREIDDFFAGLRERSEVVGDG